MSKPFGAQRAKKEKDVNQTVQAVGQAPALRTVSPLSYGKSTDIYRDVLRASMPATVSFPHQAPLFT